MNSLTNLFARPATLSAIALFAAFSLPQAEAGFPSSESPVNPGAPNEDGYEAIAGEVIVRFNPQANAHQIDAAIARVQGKLLKHKRTKAMEAHGLRGITLVSASLPVPQAVAALANMPGVDHAEPNYVYQKQNGSSWVNDEFYGDTQFPLWGMYGDASGNVSSPANTYGSRADETWWLTINLPSALPLDPDPVYVGVIDEGICYYHPDLEGNIGNPLESGPLANDGLDNDGNGKVDDAYGWDFVSEDNTVFDPVTGQPDIDAHGTHVSGTIGAKISNTIGVVGVFPSVHIISAKFLAPNGGTTWDAIEAVDYFTDLKDRGVNVVALNNSWGGGGYSSELHAAIIRAANANILFVAAAGNGNLIGIGQNNDTKPSYPSSYDTTVPVTIGSQTFSATYDSVISVAAIDSSGNKAGFSNYGAKSVDIGAPGVGIVSTYPYNLEGTDAKSVASRDPVRGAYIPYNGTSMATPHVTGAVALYAARWPNASPAALKGTILKTAVATSSLNGKCVSNGRLNLARINEQPDEAPSVPGNFRAAAGKKGQISLSWTDSGPETKYELQRATNTSFTSGLTTITLSANTTSYLDKNLKSGTTYSYRIRAINFTGTTAYSTVATLKAP